MKLIPPSKISGEIFNIIDETDDFLVLVSPYIQIAGWPKLTSRLNSLIKRDIKFKIYVRDGQKNLNSINKFKELWTALFGEAPSNKILTEYLNEIIGENEFNILKYSKSQIVEKTKIFLEKKGRV